MVRGCELPGVRGGFREFMSQKLCWIPRSSCGLRGRHCEGGLMNDKTVSACSKGLLAREYVREVSLVGSGTNSPILSCLLEGEVEVG